MLGVLAKASDFEDPPIVQSVHVNRTTLPNYPRLWRLLEQGALGIEDQLLQGTDLMNRCGRVKIKVYASRSQDQDQGFQKRVLGIEACEHCSPSAHFLLARPARDIASRSKISIHPASNSNTRCACRTP